MTKPIGQASIEYCHRCDRDTSWEPLYAGARRVRCTICQDVFPCRHVCTHLDCIEERARWAQERKAS